MPIMEPLDVSQFVDEDIDIEYEVEIVRRSEPKTHLQIPHQPNEKFRLLSDSAIDDEIRKYQRHLREIVNIDPSKMEKYIDELMKEKLFREWDNKRNEQANGRQQAKPAVKGAENGDNGRPKSTRASASNRRYVNDIYAKTDSSGSQSKGHEANGTAFSEECVLINPSKGKGPFTQRSPNTESSTLDGRKNASRIYSGDLAGPSPRPGLRSGSKLCGQCGGSSTESSCTTCRFYRKQPKRYFSKELPERNSSPGPGRRGNGVKRARQGGGDSPVVELFSSEDEEVKVTQDTVADCQIASQRKGYGTRSRLSSSLEGVRIAYPSRDDPEAIEVEYHDLHRLEPMEFLNDTVIDFYIKYIQRPEVLTLEDKNKFYFFNSFFYKKLTEVVGGQNKKTLADLSKLSKWTKGTNIFDKEYLFVPIHDKWHWSLAIVCHPGAASEDIDSQRCILHLDSMSPGHKSNNVFRLLRTYLIAEWEHQADKARTSQFEKLTNEDFTVKKIPVPQQENESDCGLFLLHYIERFIKEAPSSFKLSDVDELGLFGRNWFKPSQASGLRSEILQLLLEFFEQEVSRAKENAETIEKSVQHQELENGLQNDTQKASRSDMVIQGSCSPGLCIAAELVHEHNIPGACTTTSDSSSGGSPAADVSMECAEQHLGTDVEMFSQANCTDPRESTQLPGASMLESTADVGTRSPSSATSAGFNEEGKMQCDSNSRDTDVGDNKSGIPLVVDIPIQKEQGSAD
ncbi:unnamed protein product [Calypogeia fissa]